MKHLFALAFAAMLPAMAAAQSVPDATISLIYSDQPYNVDYQNFEITAGTSGPLGANFGYQVDGYYLKYVNYPNDDTFGANFHLTYDVNNSLSVGAFLGPLNWQDTLYTEYGVEAVYDRGPFRIDAIIADDMGTTSNPYYHFGGTYTFGNGFGLGIATAHYTGFANTFLVEASQRLNNNKYVSFSALDTKDEGIIYRLSFTKKLGKGAKFMRPDYLKVFGIW